MRAIVHSFPSFVPLLYVLSSHRAYQKQEDGPLPEKQIISNKSLCRNISISSDYKVNLTNRYNYLCKDMLLPVKLCKMKSEKL